ncbi:hypothetical protein TS71_15855 [Mycolicibacterium neoaurum]|uniref:Uncharacterized protein n=1 Tax=Mycolicibacterium neoaurum VKM Ac-1815D TaxID=700508 RepID=V5XJ30_MYCNE|nr:hypothetical protein D174_11840 [Mycolicibacterium neoaurum VKM Ac-1815D]AMO05730.1 hypothetical protein MyAD_11620 [Mycolicibacterium neoaurum]KJQ49421.1 hypothetical protein TS71_15855 [Mycolicibacterium neoaurum]KUM09059.1 hypothetical protein AVZ31_07700 [Mycolicibacterium neoaurum]
MQECPTLVGAGTVEIPPNGRRAEPGTDHQLDLHHPGDVLPAVPPVTVGGPAGNQQPTVFVMPQGTGADTGRRSQLTDQHDGEFRTRS